MLSVIVCTYNRDKYIYNQLKSLAKNTLAPKDYEIVLINNNSTDNTEQECQRFQKDFPNNIFRYFVETQQGLSYARNRGIQESKGDIFVYVDDDATVNTEYLAAYSLFFEQQPEVMAAGGPIIPVYETKEPKWFSHYTEQLITAKLYYGESISEFKGRAFPGGGNAAYRREVFEVVGLFNTDLGRKGGSLLGAEEKDIFDKMRSLNMKIFYLPKAILFHIIPPQKLSKEYFTKLTRSIGKSERLRTLAISKGKYYKRLILECVKWCGAFVLFLFFCITLRPQKGIKLLAFRWNVSIALLGF